MKNLFLVGAVALGFAVLAKDYHHGFWSMGYNSSENNMHLLPNQSVCVTTQKTLAFHGVTLDDLADCDFIGIGCGGYTTVGSPERNYNKARNIQKHYNADGKLDLIVFDIPMRFIPGSTIIKSLTIALENGEVGVMAYVPDGDNSARYATTTDENYRFVTLGADGKRTYQGTAGKLATSPTVSGYGIAGLSAVRVVPVAQAGLVFKGCTLEDIRNHSFHGVSVGAWVGQPGPMIGCNKVVFDDADGKATKIRVEMQRIEGVNLKCAIVELTNGEGGVYARNVAACYCDSSSYGFKFVNANGSYAGTGSTPSIGYPENGYGVCGLTATEVPTSSPFRGFLDSTNKVLWASQSLDRFVDFPAVHHGAYVPKTETAKSLFYMRTGRGSDIKLEFESQSLMGTSIRSGAVALEQKGNHIVGRVLRFAYGEGAPDGRTSYLNGGTGVALSLGPNMNGYALRDLEGRALEPVYTAVGEAAAWSALDWSYEANSNALAEVTLTGSAFDFDAPVTAGMVRINATNDLTLTASGGSIATRYLDLTDAKGMTTLAFAPTNLSITAGRDTVFTVAPTNCAISVAADNRITMDNPSFLSTCGLYARGKLKFTGDFNQSTPPNKDFGTAQSVELAGTHVLQGCKVTTSNGFHWSNPGKLILSGDVTLLNPDDCGDFCTAVSTTPGEIVVVEGGSLTCPDRVKFQSQNADNARGALAIEGGVISGGWIYFNVGKNQQLNIRVDGGRFETGVCPWTGYNDRRANLQLVQTGGTFAPNTLQPINDGSYQGGSVSTYTFKGGVFEPPAGWLAAYPWLPITVPAEGDATMKIVRDALIPSAVTVAADARLTLESTASANTLTFASLVCAGTLRATGNTPARLSYASALAPAVLEIDEGATFVKAGTGTMTLQSTLNAETAAGSIALEGGSLFMTAPASIGGALALSAGTTLSLDTGTQFLADRQAVFTAPGGITLGEGVVLADVAKVTGGSLVLSEDHTQLLFVADVFAPVVAAWTGHGNRALSSDPANWSCTNALGQAIAIEAGVIPTALTTVFMTGETSFNLPTGQALTCRNLVIYGELALTSDCDWCGLGTVTFADDCTLDLAGHRLDVFGLACPTAGSATITNTTETAGALHVVVPAGQTSGNATVALGGNFTLVKEGAGTFNPTFKEPCYTGGTELREGQLTAVGRTYPPASGLTLTICSNTTFEADCAHSDTGRNCNLSTKYILDGGTIANTTADGNANWTALADVRLTEDSAFNFQKDFGFIGAGFGPTTLDLAGHELRVAVGTSESYFWLFNVDVTAGRIVVTSGGWTKFDKTSVRAGSTDFDINCALDIQVPVFVHDLTLRYGNSSFTTGGGVMSIAGTFRPATRYIHNFQLENGATLDVSLFDGVYNLYDDVSKKTLRFAGNSTVYVAVGEREIADKDYIVTWATKPEGVQFLRKPNMRGSITVVEDGIRYNKTGLVILLR